MQGRSHMWVAPFCYVLEEPRIDELVETVWHFEQLSDLRSLTTLVAS